MYSWDMIQPELDSTLRLIHESINRGHKVSIIYPNEMAIRRTIVWGNCHVIKNKNAISKNLEEFYNSTTFTEELSPLKDQDVIFLRDNPPLDNHLLNFLDTLENVMEPVEQKGHGPHEWNPVRAAQLCRMRNHDDSSR